MKPGIKTGGTYFALVHGYLQIFPESLRAETSAEKDEEDEGGA